MTLFSQLTPEVKELIQEYSELINNHLDEWIKNELRIKGGLAGDVCRYLQQKKKELNPRSTVKLTPDRKRIIDAQVRQGYGMKQFKGVVDHLVKKWGDDPNFRQYLTPETIFRKSNFQKYLEEARENIQEFLVTTTNVNEYR